MACAKRTGSRICFVQYSGQLISLGPAIWPVTFATSVKRGALNSTVLRTSPSAGSAGSYEAGMSRVANP